MTKIKYLFQNISLLNILLIGVVAFFLHYTVSPYLIKSIKFTVPGPGKPPDTHEVSRAEPAQPSPSDFMIISEENLFHPERKIPTEKKAEQELPKPEFILYGTLITDTFSVAYLEDMKAPRSTPGRGKRQIAMKKGDSLSGYRLNDIRHDRIILIRGEDKITVHIHDPQKPKVRDTAVATVSQPSTGQPPHIPPRTTAATPQRTPSPQTLIKPEPLTKRRAPMTPADEKVRDFFIRNK